MFGKKGIKMNNKVITFVSPGIAELQNIAVREPADGEVLVRLFISSVSSGTERANLVGEVNVSYAGNETVAHFPRTLGYSSAGVVEKIGAGVESVKPGDRVALSWSVHSAYCTLPERNVHKIISEDISFNEAALFHIGTFPAAAIRKCRLEFGESALVMGLGVLGTMAVSLLKAAGAVPIIAVDPVAERREKALEFGADYAFDPFETGFSEKVREVTDGGVNVAIEVTGNGGGLNGALNCMKRFGRVALLGCTRHSDFTVDYYKKIHGPGITLIGAHTLARPDFESYPGYWTTHDDVTAVQKLTVYGRLKLENLIDEVHSPTEAPEVYKRLAEEKSFPLVQFDWRLL